MIIDAAVHPILEDAQLKRLVGQPWSGGRFPNPLGTRYQPPIADLVVSIEQAVDPAATADLLFAEHAVDVAILTPLGRGLLPNPQHAAAVASATNSWLADHWLACPEAADRFVGSIRVAVTDVAAALLEIEAWADDHRFVQVVVPLRVFLPYGDDFYFPIWRLAAERNLTVCVYDDLSSAVEYAETPAGRPRYFAEKHSLTPLAGLVHLSSLITSGVFDRLPDLRFLFGDGSIDLARTILWRLDKDWRSGRMEIPWVAKLPSLYAADHIRFVSQREDGTVDGEQVEDDLIRVSEADRLLLFGSHYPYWHATNARTALAEWPSEARERIMGQNALEATPRLDSYVAALERARTA